MTVSFPIEPFARYCLLNGVDELGFLLEPRSATIEAFEQRAHESAHRGPAPATASARRSSPKACAASSASRSASGMSSSSASCPSAARPSTRTRDPLPATPSRRACSADAMLLGAIGGPKWSAPEAKVRPEQGLLRLRARARCVYANLRPVRGAPGARRRLDAQARGARGRRPRVRARAHRRHLLRREAPRCDAAPRDLCTYTVAEIERITRVAARLARTRRRKLTSIDKANVLETSRLWREVAHAGHGRGVSRT